jgi:hypothetical protein
MCRTSLAVVSLPSVARQEVSFIIVEGDAECAASEEHNHETLLSRRADQARK